VTLPLPDEIHMAAQIQTLWSPPGLFHGALKQKENAEVMRGFMQKNSIETSYQMENTHVSCRGGYHYSIMSHDHPFEARARAVRF
jgi:hypothetical protein